MQQAALPFYQRQLAVMRGLYPVD